MFGKIHFSSCSYPSSPPISFSYLVLDEADRMVSRLYARHLKGTSAIVYFLFVTIFSWTWASK